MAKIIENSKGFKVIEISDRECKEKIGGLGICDNCNKDFQTAYYVAVLNHCYCQGCYDDWMGRAKNYASDRIIEEKNFQWMIKNVLVDPFDLEVQFELFLKKSGGDHIGDRTKSFVKDVFLGSFYQFMVLVQEELSVLSEVEAIMAWDRMERQFNGYAAQRLEEKKLRNESQKKE